MPISAGAGAILAPIAGTVLGKLFGGDSSAQAMVPQDLQGQRQNNIDLLSHLLGFPSGGGGGVRGRPGNAYGVGTPLGGRPNPFGNANMDPGSRLESFFGQLTSPLQRQATGGMSQYLNQPAPEQRAFDMATPGIESILGGKPGQGIMEALTPMFERNLASANQQGARFGSGNAILRSRAVDDFNLLGAQAAQQGQQTQLQAAQILGMLGQSAGQGPFNRMQGAMAAGDIEPARRIALLQQLLGTSQQATLGQPTQVNPSGAQQGMQAGFGIAQLLPWLGQMMSGGIPQGSPFPGPPTSYPNPLAPMGR